MMYSILFWLLANLFSIAVLAFYSMSEMACVSFNKARLHYYTSKGYKRAMWLNELLKNPSRLFGTTLIGVNIAMVIGSECSREFHRAIGLSPDLAPLSQVIIVVILGELAPMFAARHYPESVALSSAPLLYGSAVVMRPVLWIVGVISQFSNRLLGLKIEDNKLFLSEEELQKMIEEHDEAVEGQEFNVIVSNIFRLRDKTAKEILTPIEMITSLPSNSTIQQVRNIFRKKDIRFLPIYHNRRNNIIGIVHPREILRESDKKRVRDYINNPWFITVNTTLIEILNQFRKNNRSVAVILNELGKAIGMITLDDVIREIFGDLTLKWEEEDQHMVIERTFSGTTTVRDFEEQFGVFLNEDKNLTLSKLMAKYLGHTPERGDEILIDTFEFTAIEISFLEVKTISIKTRI